MVIPVNERVNNVPSIDEAIADLELKLKLYRMQAFLRELEKEKKQESI